MEDGAVCPECGLLHPPCPPGECPVAKDRQLKQKTKLIRNEVAIKLMQSIQTKLVDKLTELPPDKCEQLVVSIFKVIQSF